MEIMRLVVAGTVGAGKSTFIRTVSEIDVVDTDRRATDETAEIKHRTTVAMDFGRLTFGPDMALHIYGTPGQQRFDFMWDILIRKAHAFILLVAAHRPHEFRYARRILSYMNRRVQIPYIIGITHMDCEGAWSSENIKLALGFVDEQNQPPVIVLNADERETVIKAVVALVQYYIQSTSVA
jgi:signal recognition particle receptor subunit beta